MVYKACDSHIFSNKSLIFYYIYVKIILSYIKRGENLKGLILSKIMKNETSVIKENKINIMTVLKQIFWDSEKEEVDDVSQIANISEKELKELQASNKRLKKLEEEYSVEPKKEKKAKRKSTIVKNTTIAKVQNNTKSKEKDKEDDDKIQEI